MICRSEYAGQAKQINCPAGLQCPQPVKQPQVLFRLKNEMRNTVIRVSACEHIQL
jgi:hypothetical protein